MSEREALEIAEAGHIEPVPVPAEPSGRPLLGVLMVMGSVLLFAGNEAHYGPIHLRQAAIYGYALSEAQAQALGNVNTGL